MTHPIKNAAVDAIAHLLAMRGTTMGLRLVCVLPICLGLLSQAVEAGEGSALAKRASCTVVRYYVARYTAPAAEAWARSHGATAAEIDAACVGLGKSQPTQPTQPA